jgi:hypothetical protein
LTGGTIAFNWVTEIAIRKRNDVRPELHARAKLVLHVHAFELILGNRIYNQAYLNAVLINLSYQDADRQKMHSD